MKTVIIYGTFGGATEEVASEVADAFPQSELFAAEDVTGADLEGCDLLILGASTWNSGDVPTDMEEFVSSLSDWDVSIPHGAVFGLGDQIGYGDTFADGMSILADALKKKKINLVGKWPVEGYEHDKSLAQDGDHFIGLALDQDNQYDATSGRIEEWAGMVQKEIQ